MSELRKTKIQLDTVFRDKIVDCIRKNSDFVDDFIVITPDDAAEYGEETKSNLLADIDTAAEEDTSTKFKAGFTFDNFVVGDSNQLVFSMHSAEIWKRLE